MADKEETQQINAGEMPIDLVEKLDAMCDEDENSRAAFLRKMIRQEWARRHQLKLPATVDSGGRGKSSAKREIASVAG